MRRGSVLAAGIAAASILLSAVAATRAGDFVQVQGCQLISAQPPLYRLRFMFYNARGFNPFCRVHVAPASFQGSTPQPIISCTAPPSLTCSVDTTTGAALFSASPCVEWWSFADLAVIVRGVPAFFVDTLDTDVPDRKHSDMWFPCSTAVAVRRTSWGDVKLHYRP